MQAYLSLRQKIKVINIPLWNLDLLQSKFCSCAASSDCLVSVFQEDDNAELQKKLQATFKAISTAFVDVTKAEEHLQKLHQMKDNNIFKGLATLLDPNTKFEQSKETCVSMAHYVVSPFAL